MKRITFILLSTFFILFNALSQTVINFNTHAPIAGDVINFVEISFFEPGIGGKDIIWDFTSLKPLNKTVISEQKNPDKNDLNKFTFKPNIVLYEDEKSHFFNLTEKLYEQLGVIADKYELNYEKPLKRMIYPFMYEDYFDGEFEGTAFFNTNYQIDISGKYTVEADAYGLIKLPGNKIKNVIRIKQFTRSTQVSMCSVAEVDTYKYLWYSHDERYPLISCIITEQRFSHGETKLTQECYINDKLLVNSNENSLTNINETENSMFNYTVFPNPFKNDINITYELNKGFKVTVGIYDILGKRVKDVVFNENQNEGIYTYTIGASEIGLIPGMYFIKFEFDDKVITEKIIRSH